MKLDLDVKGMSCDHCVKTISDGLGDLAGVESVTVELEKGKVAVSFDEKTISQSSIVDKIKDLGFETE